MIRGYDVIFKNLSLGMIFTGVLVFLFIALLVLGGLHVKRIMERDSASRKKYREEHHSQETGKGEQGAEE